MATDGVTHHRMFIGGEDVDSEEIFEIRHPATNELVCTMAKGTVEHADRAVASARAAFDSGIWANKPPAERAAIMHTIGERIADDLDDFIAAEISCNGATVRQAMGFHGGLASPHFLHFAAKAATYAFEQDVPTAPMPTPSTNRVRREPIGVCAAIVPWNFPLVLGIWKIGPALAAGNSIVVKVDEQTPLSLLRLAQIAQECGVPPGVLNVVSGEGKVVGAHLASHPDVDKIAFTGSTAVGREIMRLASATVKKVTLELGGKAATIVLPDADLETTADGCLFGCMLYSGQICESSTRVLVHESIHDAFVDRLVARAATIKLGDPADPETDMGPVISERRRDRIVAYLEQAKADGANVALGGGVPTDARFERGWWIEPTIFTGVTNDMQIARDEVFGPVMVVIKYATVAKAIATANDTSYGLTAGVWSTDLAAAAEVGGQLRAGTVWVNTWHQIDPTLPFGGYKQSGIGRELGEGALDEYTETKHLHVDLTIDREQNIFGILLSTPPGS